MSKKLKKESSESLTPKARAESRDAFVRAFDEQFSNWVSIAKCCVDVKRDKDWELLPPRLLPNKEHLGEFIVRKIETWNEWLASSAPRSRSYIYLAIGRYEELEPDIPEKELEKMKLGAAGILMSVSSKIRQNPKVRKAASSKPAELRQVLEQEFPEQHVESVIEKHLKFPLSQWEKIESVYETYKLTDETATLEDFIEWLVSEQE